MDYVNHIARESGRFGELVARTPLNLPVPSCPGWTVADLAFHLGEVQAFWAGIVAELKLDVDDYEEPARPRDDRLSEFFTESSRRLLAALRTRKPEDPCWSWYDGGRSVGWVRRRQAHEAAIHRLDAELAADAVTPIDIELAADGIDELLTIFLDANSLPDWAQYATDGRTARIELGEPERSWTVDLGRFTGTSPRTGTAYDDPAVRLIEPGHEPSAVLTGSASDMQRWLWGRGPLESIEVTGDATVPAHIREAAVRSTQ